MMTELKNCPFCGSEKDLFSMPREMFISNGVSKNVGWSCICAHCDAHVWGREQEDTEATWNTRPIEDALQARIPQWISVKDRLPEDGTRVMAYVNGWHEVAWHRKSIREWQFRDEIAFNNETNTYGLVTHWMPLPEPPEENE